VANFSKISTGLNAIHKLNDLYIRFKTDNPTFVSNYRDVGKAWLKNRKIGISLAQKLASVSLSIASLVGIPLIITFFTSSASLFDSIGFGLFLLIVFVFTTISFYNSIKSSVNEAILLIIEDHESAIPPVT